MKQTSCASKTVMAAPSHKLLEYIYPNMPSTNQLIELSVLCFIIAILVWAVAEVSRRGRRPRKGVYAVDRHGGNPLLSPQIHRDWEAEGAFNPGVIEDDAGDIHLFYRAAGSDGLSRIGHAVSRDGRTIVERSPYPVYVPVHGAGMPDGAGLTALDRRYDIVLHPSGGGWGGAEDPRVTRIGGRIYMTYTAFEGWDNMRIGLTSISMADLKRRRWNWRRPIMISPPKARSKNWVVFPEKINGKYAILHSVAPKVMIAYVDSLDAVPTIKSSSDHGGYGYHDNHRKGFWDETTKGAGTPPLRTDKGWLVLYHAVQPGKYLVGAMLLDLADPTCVLYRSPQPILSPDMPYENDGKPGVVYATGAIVKDGQLLIYYGGGDKHTCMAETPLQPLLEWLVKYGKV